MHGCGNFSKSCKFFCRGLDMQVQNLIQKVSAGIQIESVVEIWLILKRRKISKRQKNVVVD